MSNTFFSLAAAVVATAVAVKTVPLKDENHPDFSRNVSIQQARAQKIFGTVKSFKVNPNARPKLPIYDAPEATPAPAVAAAVVVVAPTPVAVQVRTSSVKSETGS